MVNQNPVRVVKCAERGRPGPRAAANTKPEPSSRERARALAARVREWVSEFEQARPVRLQELRRQLGWQEMMGDGLSAQAVSDPVVSQK